MNFCPSCGKEIDGAQKYCIHCGAEVTAAPPSEPVPPAQSAQAPTPEPVPPAQSAQAPTPEPPKRAGSKPLPPVAIAAGAVAATCLLLFVLLGRPGGKTDPSPTPDTSPTPDSMLTQSVLPLSPAPTPEPVPAGEMQIVGIDTSAYPLLTLAVETRNLETLSLEHINVFDGGTETVVQSVQQLASSDGASVYRIEVMAAQPPDDALFQKTRLVHSGLSSELDYEIPRSREPVTLAIHQIDTDNFPEVSVYFSMQNPNGEYVVSDDARFFNLLDASGAVSAEQLLSGLRTTQDTSHINIALVLDRSGSMETGGIFHTAQETAAYFLDLLNYGKGDSAAVVSFDHNVYLSHFFSADSTSLQNAIWNMRTDGMTALYDALHVALLETAGQNGAKCIVALTDGLDNSSAVTPQTVIYKARELGIPIYIIGLGHEDYSEAYRIAVESGGYFTNIYDISDIRAIYDGLFAQQQHQMAATYTIPETSYDAPFQDVRLQFKNHEYIGEIAAQFQYQHIVNPNREQEDIDVNVGSMDDIERAIYLYEHQFVKAVNAYDFNLLKDYLDPSGGLYETQRGLLDTYRTRGVRERLLYYKINSLRPLGGDAYEAVVTEQFYIQIGNEQASYKEFENVYIIRNTPLGYKVSELTDLTTLSDRSVDIFLY